MKKRAPSTKNRWMIWSAVIVLGALGIYLLWFSQGTNSTTLEDYGTAPNPAFKDIAGKEWKLSDFSDRPTLLFFFAVWCPSCETEVASLQQIQTSYPGKIHIILVDVDPVEDTVGDLRGFASKHGNIDFTYVYDEYGTLVNAFGVSALQTTVVIDQGGHVVYRDELMAQQGTLGKVLDELLQ